MGSNGVESSALIEHAHSKQIPFDIGHVVHNNRSLIEENKFGAARVRYCTDSDTNYYRLDFTKEKFDEHWNMIQHKDTACWIPGAILFAARGAYDEVWFGCHANDQLQDVNDIFGVFNLMMTSIGKVTRLKAPLATMSKLDQYRMIPDSIKEHLVYCSRINADMKPCGDCGKCREFDKYVASIGGTYE